MNPRGMERGSSKSGIKESRPKNQNGHALILAENSRRFPAAGGQKEWVEWGGASLFLGRP